MQFQEKPEDMTNRIRQILAEGPIGASAPCRIDLGGTLDISSLFYPLAYLGPCTFNAAIDMRTRVRLAQGRPGRVRVASAGFESAEYPIDEMPFDHRLGLIFAIAAYFRIDGIGIEIDSASPPRSALGGSSAAAVALVTAFSSLLQQAGQSSPDYAVIAALAHAIEESIAGVPCGMQDQLAAIHGGVNAWHWKADAGRPGYRKQHLISAGQTAGIEKHILVAYCGVPHESKDINGTWIRRFLAGRDRRKWIKIVELAQQFVRAFVKGDFIEAARCMNHETRIRRELTPEVVDEIGAELVAAAAAKNCGARFTGAGGGGCLWAIGPAGAIADLRPLWADIVSRRPDGKMLDVGVDTVGVCLEE